jgi:hypothetical protein
LRFPPSVLVSKKPAGIRRRHRETWRPGAPDLPAATGIAGPTLSPKQHVAEFRKVEQSWRHYQKAACTAAFHQFDGGTGGPSFELECELKLDRSHMHELDMIYGEDLHL